MAGGLPGRAKVVIPCGFSRYRALGVHLPPLLLGICGVAALTSPNVSGALVEHRRGFLGALLLHFYTLRHGGVFWVRRWLPTGRSRSRHQGRKLRPDAPHGALEGHNVLFCKA